MQSGFVEKLPCELTRDEKESKANEMAELIKVHGEVEIEMKSVAEGFKRHLKKLDQDITDRAEEVRTGVEHRLVECTERGRYRDNKVDVIRCDTGETVRSRPMTITERQDSLPFNEDAPSARQ